MNYKIKIKKRIKELEELINKKEDNIKKFQKEIGNNSIKETESDSIMPTNENFILYLIIRI